MRFFKVLVFGLLLSAGAQAFAQAETFDMITFTPPKGWERNEFKDRVTLLKPDRSCMVAVYESRESTGSGETDFKSEWQERVAKQFNTAAVPSRQDALPAEGGDGEARMGGANIESGGAKVSVLLTVYRGGGRAMSVLGLNPNRCEDEFTDFMTKLEFSKTRKAR
jgi:hypothetical protein